MKLTKTILLCFVLTLALVNCDTKRHNPYNAASQQKEGLKQKVEDVIHKVEEKAKDALHLNERNMPPKAGETVEDVKEGLKHAEQAVKQGVDAVKADGIKNKIHNAYGAVKETIKTVGSTKDTVTDAQKVHIEAGKDAAKEAVQIHGKHEDLKHKIEDAKDFVKEEINQAKEEIKKVLGDEPKKTTEEETDKNAGLGERIHATYEEVKHKLEDVKDAIKEEIHEVADKIHNIVKGDSSEADKDSASETKTESKEEVKEESDGENNSTKKNNILHSIIEGITSVGDKVKTMIGHIQERYSSDSDPTQSPTELEDEYL